MQSTHLTIQLELLADGDAISGTVSGPADGESQEFSGWLGLVAAIDALVQSERDESSTSVSSTTTE